MGRIMGDLVAQGGKTSRYFRTEYYSVLLYNMLI